MWLKWDELYYGQKWINHVFSVKLSSAEACIDCGPIDCHQLWVKKLFRPIIFWPVLQNYNSSTNFD